MIERAIEDAYVVFGRHRLRPRFADRCSPVGDRRDYAERLERDPKAMPDLAIYAFKATLTMGDEADLLFFAPYMLDVSAHDPTWWEHVTNFYEKLAKLELGHDERAAILGFMRAFVATFPARFAEYVVECVAPFTDPLPFLPEVRDDMPVLALRQVASVAACFPTNHLAIDTWLAGDRVIDVLTRAYVREASAEWAEELAEGIERLEQRR